jgi:hypothetical protein
MPTITEKPDFKNAKAVKVCQKVMSVRVQVYEKLYIYGILRKTVYGMDFS